MWINLLMKKNLKSIKVQFLFFVGSLYVTFSYLSHNIWLFNPPLVYGYYYTDLLFPHKCVLDLKYKPIQALDSSISLILNSEGKVLGYDSVSYYNPTFSLLKFSLPLTFSFRSSHVLGVMRLIYI